MYRSSGNRYVHEYPTPGTARYEQGKEQAEISIERFHYLRASILKKYRFVDGITPNLSLGQIFPRQGLDFSEYDEYHLEPVSGVKLHPRQDGTIHPGDIERYHDGFKENWKSSEGGLLYYIGEAREFYNIILNYHSPARTTGDLEWDEFFAKLKREDFPKSEIPCMVRPRLSPKVVTDDESINHCVVFWPFPSSFSLVNLDV